MSWYLWGQTPVVATSRNGLKNELESVLNTILICLLKQVFCDLPSSFLSKLGLSFLLLVNITMSVREKVMIGENFRNKCGIELDANKAVSV